MPQIRSDDGPRKLRAVWLGPKGSTLPFEWTYVQWLVCLLASMTCGTCFLVVLWIAWAPIYGLAAAVLYGVPAGFYLGVKVMRRVSFDEPIHYRLAMAYGQLTDRGPTASNDPIRWQLRLPPISDLSPGTLRALRWAPDPTVTPPTEDTNHADHEEQEHQESDGSTGEDDRRPAEADEVTETQHRSAWPFRG